MDSLNRRFDRRWVKAMVWGLVGMTLALLILNRREEAIREQGRPIDILVAAMDLPEGIALTPDQLATRTVPRQFAPPGVLRDPLEAVGMVTLIPVRTGEPITITRVASATKRGALSALLSAGTRAISIPVNAVSGVAGFIQPGDRIDLLAEFEFGSNDVVESQVMTILHGVEVMAVGKKLRSPIARQSSSSGESRAVPPTTITLAVSPTQAQRVAFALTNGHIHLTLRSRGEVVRRGELPAATAATVTGQSSLLRRREYRGR